ncbi:MAG: hypothetical protein QNJ44_14250 [Rhodobacter sp.]|nr:hypothetical protein [Rhodobacter sp.]
MTRPLPIQHGSRDQAHPALPFLGDLALPLARVHEICGNARRFLALLIASRTRGPVFWIAPAWGAERLNPEAMLRLVGPERIVFVDPVRAEDLLWCMEEVLRSGAVPLVVADIPAPPGLTAVRRLHLAAETGAAEAGTLPLGVLLTPGTGGAQGIETRWHIAGDHGADGRRRWRLDRLRARTAPQKSWRVTSAKGAFRLESLAEETLLN